MHLDPPTKHAHGAFPSGPDTSHAPSCACCLTYPAVKMKEKARKILVTTQSHVATLERSPTKSMFNGIVLQLADLCLQYEEAERVLTRAAESGFSSKRHKAELMLASIKFAKAVKRLDSLIDNISELLGE